MLCHRLPSVTVYLQLSLEELAILKSQSAITSVQLAQRQEDARDAGEFRTAALLAAPERLCLFNTGKAFKTENIAAGHRAVGGKLRVEEGDVADGEIRKWAGE